MALAIAQFTITDFNDVDISTTQPSTPIIDQLWLDTSLVPNQLKRWDGSKWVVTNAQGRNLARNSAFRKDTSSWTLTTGWSRDTSKTYDVGTSLKVNLTGLASNAWNACFTGYINCNAGDDVAASLWVYIPTGHGIDQGAATEIEWWNASTRISTTSATLDLSKLDQWQRVMIYGKAPANTVRIRMRSHPNRNGMYWVALGKIEFGTICTDWTPAIEDVNTTTDALDTRVTSAEQKITPTAIVSTVTTSTTYQTDLGNKLNTAELSSKIQQSSSDVKIAMGQVGGNNLIKNSTFRFNLDNWGNTSAGITLAQGFSTEVADYYMKLTNANATEGFIWQTGINLMSSTQYTLSGWYYTNGPSGDVYLLGQKSATAGYAYDYTHGSSTLSTLNKWTKFTLTFTTAADEIKALMRLDHNGGTTGQMFYSQLKLELGANATSWSAHDGEVSNALATFNDGGLQISHSNVGTKTVMSAGGFKILNSTGEEIGSLASNSGLTKLTADTITANNVYSVDSMDRALYVNGSTGLDTNAGTSAAPFRTVKQALNTLADFGRVRSADKKGVIYIYGAITEDIYVRNFVGGVVELRFDRTCTINGKISVEYCTAQLNLYGGRTSSTDTGGCLITNKDTNATALNAYYSNTLYIHGFRITNKGGHGVAFTGSNGYVQWCDINYCNANGMACIKASYNSAVGVHDCTGSNNGIPLYADYGAVINVGQQGNAAAVLIPNATSANYGAYSGYVYGLSTLTKTNSAYAPAAVTTQVYTTYYNATSTKSWRDVYNAWRSDNNYIYQGQYSGNGNHRGFMIFDSATIRSNLSGATIQDIQLRLVRLNSGGNSASQTVYLWGHSYTAVGGGYDLPISYGAIGSWAWGEDKWVTIPIQAATDLKNGTIQGLAIYSSSGSPYATFDINAQLWIKYEK